MYLELFCVLVSRLVFAGSRRSIVNSESETRNVDDVVVSTMRRTEAREVIVSS